MMRRMTMRSLAAVALCMVGACASYDPASVSMEKGSSGAVLLIESLPVTTDVDVGLSGYDEKTQSASANPFGGFVHLRVMPGSHYAAESVRPGTYIFQTIGTQTFWAACLHAKTIVFDVRPGEVLFLGKLDPRPHLDLIQREATRNGQMVSINNAVFHYMDNIPAPDVEFPGGREAALGAAQDYVQHVMTKVHAPVGLAEYRPGQFGHGYSLFGQPVCGGYFKDKPKG